MIYYKKQVPFPVSDINTQRKTRIKELGIAAIIGPVVAVVIPSYRVKAPILPLLARIGPEVTQIFVVDDACPEGTGALS